MRVVDAGEHGPAAQLDGPGAGSGQGAHFRVADDSQDVPAAHGEALGDGEPGVHGQDLSAGQDETGSGVAHG
ncbi:hypothetical protein AB0D62_23195 [Streptomyces massasporeus]|uniref:hypothetical protein n=1 Tax=Streptomyces massasporeus TaxID=67324 RepID=UPI0033E0E09F